MSTEHRPDPHDSAAEHLAASQEASEQAREEYEDLPTAHRPDDSGHKGSQGQQAPAD